MKSVKYVFAYAIISVLLCSCSSMTDSVSSGYNPTGTITDVSKKDWGSVLFNFRYRVINNVWNKNATTGPYSQSVFTERFNATEGFGWQWNWVNQSNMVVVYPEVVYGDKPWDAVSGIDYPFPVQAGLYNITVDFNAIVNARGVYNMAFSLWCVSNQAQGVDSITHEIMIWTINNGMTPAGTKYASIAIDGNDYDVYMRRNHSDDSGGSSHQWTYIAFAAKQNITKGPLVLSDFTDYLIKQGLLNSAYYVTSVEFGNEIVYGAGCTELQNYSISLSKKAE